MTPERAKKLLPIIQAYAEGKTIQIYVPPLGIWEDIEQPNFDGHGEYRIKPAPKVIYVNEYEDGGRETFDDEQFAKEVSAGSGPNFPIRTAVKYIEASD